MQSKKICIFGGAGFVGRYLCAQVLSYNNHVTIMDIVKEPKWIYDEKDVRYVNVSSDFELNSYLEQQFDYVFLIPLEISLIFLEGLLLVWYPASHLSQFGYFRIYFFPGHGLLLM